MNPSNLIFHSLIKRINSVRIKEKVNKIFTGVFYFVCINLASLLLMLSINSIFKFEMNGRFVLDLIYAFILFGTFFFFIFKPTFSLLFRKDSPSINEIADRIGVKFPSIKDKLANALQIFHFHHHNPQGYSLALVDRALTEVDETSKAKDFLSIINRRQLFRSVRYAAISFIFSIIFFIIFLNDFSSSAYHLLHPFAESQMKPDYKLIVSPGNTQVLKNDNVEINVNVEGISPESIVLHAQHILNGYEYEKVLNRTQQNSFNYIFENIKDSTEYYFSSNEYTTEKYLISVIELPIVRHLQIKLTYPLYTKIEPRYLDENVGDITALKGTIAEIKIEANKQLDAAWLEFHNKEKIGLELHHNVARGRINIKNDDSYHIKLTDLSDRLNNDPIDYRINVIEDNLPMIKIVEPGRDVDISEDMKLFLVMEGEDDFGFSNLQLAYKINRGGENVDENYSYISLKSKNLHEEKFRVDYDWDLTDLNLFPEDAVTYYAEVFDNDVVSGPKSAKSLIFTIRFPSIYEIYTEVEQEQHETFQTFEGMYEQSKELKEHLSELVQEMKKDANLNWEEKKKLEDIVDGQHQLQQSMEEVEHRIDEMLDRMEKNDLVSMETLKKYVEVQQLMQQIMTEELKNAIKELQKAMDKIDPEELKKAVENLDINQEEFLRNLEKTLEILKRLQIEQKMDEVAKKAAELLKEQKELLEQANKASEDDGNKLAKEQQDIQNKTDDLKDDISKLSSNMNEFPDMPKNQVEAAMDLMDRENIKGNMQQASQCFQKGNMQSGQQHGQMAQNSLSELTDMLQNAKQELMQNQKQQVMNQLKHLTHDLLSLSMSQEDALNNTKSINRKSSAVESIADKQQNLISGLSRIIDKTTELSKRTLFVTQDIQRSMAQSLNEMQKSLTNLEERNGTSASRNQGNAMVALNEAIKQIQKSMQNLSSSGSSTGMQQLLDQLSQMANKQQGINQQTMQLGLGQQPMSLQQQAMMARMAAEQNALKKSLEQLQQEYGNRSEILGRLDKIAEDMKDVIQDLQRKNVSPKTLERQKQILSRLLDAQHSIHKREYSRKRKAETGKYYLAKSPTQLPSNLGERDSQLREDLLKALKQGYTRDYQELIKKYFEVLVNEKESN